jgi:hypothetical protein
MDDNNNFTNVYLSFFDSNENCLLKIVVQDLVW